MKCLKTSSQSLSQSCCTNVMFCLGDITWLSFPLYGKQRKISNPNDLTTLWFDLIPSPSHATCQFVLRTYDILACQSIVGDPSGPIVVTWSTVTKVTVTDGHWPLPEKGHDLCWRLSCILECEANGHNISIRKNKIQQRSFPLYFGLDGNYWVIATQFWQKNSK